MDTFLNLCTVDTLFVAYRTEDPQSPKGIDPVILAVIAKQLKVKLNYTYMHWGYYDVGTNMGIGMVGSVRIFF